VVKHDGDVLLLIGEEVLQPLDGATIDLAETPEGAHLVVINPDVPGRRNRAAITSHE
jgi:Fe-S cluster assembly iron-binding protein IscA